MTSRARPSHRATVTAIWAGRWLLPLCLVVGCRTAARAPSGTTPSPIVASASPDTEAACETCGGVWGPQGLSGRVGCNCHSRDAGRACHDGADCEGQCVLGEPPLREPPRGGALGPFVGRCSERVTAFGCARLLPRGFAQGASAALAEPPPVICID